MVACGNRLLLVLCLVLSGTAQTRALEDIPETGGSTRPKIDLVNNNHEISESLFEGDIVLTPEQKLLLQKRKATQWANFWYKDSSSTASGTASGTTSSIDSGTTSSTDSGTTSGTNSVTTSGTNSGTNSSTDSGTTSSIDSGTTSSIDSGTTSSIDSGTTSSTDSGTTSGTNSVTDSTTLPPSTTTTGPLQVTFVNSGSIPLIKTSSSTGSCRLRGASAAGYQELTSSWYPFWYWPGEFCNHHTETSEPRYLRVTATTVTTGPRDAIFIKSLFNAEKSITSAQAGRSYVFPSTAVNIYFKSSFWWFCRRYKLTIDVLNSNCHQIVRVQPGATGTLTKTNYAANTVCEWWIQAPSGKQIKLDFTAFKVGQFDCSSDYLAIDTSGDKRYETASQQYCGRHTPGSVTSTGGQLNVILNGFQGRSPGFTATYTVV